MYELKNFLDKYGQNTTTNFYLRDIAKDLGIKVSIIMSDELDQRSASPKGRQLLSSTAGDELVSCKAGQSPYLEKQNLIINLQTSNEKVRIGF